MRCPNCGSDLLEGARFCQVCGAAVTEQSEPAAASEPAPAVQPATQAPDQGAQPTMQVPAPDQTTQMPSPEPTRSFGSSPYMPTSSSTSQPMSDTSDNDSQAPAPKKKLKLWQRILAAVLSVIVALGIVFGLAYATNFSGFRDYWDQTMRDAGEAYRKALEGDEDEPAEEEPTEPEDGAEDQGSTTEEPATSDQPDDADASEPANVPADGISGDPVSNPITVSGVREYTDAYDRQHVVFDVTNFGDENLGSASVHITATMTSRDEYGELVDEEVDIVRVESISDATISNGSTLRGCFAPGEAQNVDLMINDARDEVSYANFEVVPGDDTASEADPATDHPFDEASFSVSTNWSQEGAPITVTNNTGHYLTSCELTYIAFDENGDPWWPEKGANGDDYYYYTLRGNTLKPGDSFEKEVSYSNEALTRVEWHLVRVRYSIDTDKEASL